MPTTLQPETTPAATSISAQLAALLHHAAIAELSDIGWISVTGSDRVRWLNGMVTNSIQSLAPGEGNYNFALNAQGRIQADLTAFALEDQILLETTEAGKLATLLDHFIIMDDVELEVLRNGRAEVEDAAAKEYPFLGTSKDREGILIAGPQAETILKNIGLSVEPHASIRLQSAVWHTAPIEIIHAHSTLVPRFELWSNPTAIASLAEALTTAGATPVSPTALEHLRLLSGTPRYGIDIRNTEKSRDLPQETNQPHALNFTKGCYLGQEIVERIHSRGAVHRTLTGLLLTGALPTPGTIIEAASGPAAAPKPVGEITSAALIPLPTGPIQLAFAYLRREALAEAQAHRLTLTYPAGTATPIALPYPLH